MLRRSTEVHARAEDLLCPRKVCSGAVRAGVVLFMAEQSTCYWYDVLFNNFLLLTCSTTSQLWRCRLLHKVSVLSIKSTACFLELLCAPLQLRIVALKADAASKSSSQQLGAVPVEVGASLKATVIMLFPGVITVCGSRCCWRAVLHSKQVMMLLFLDNLDD